MFINTSYDDSSSLYQFTHNDLVFNGITENYKLLCSYKDNCDFNKKYCMGEPKDYLEYNNKQMYIFTYLFGDYSDMDEPLYHSYGNNQSYINQYKVYDCDLIFFYDSNRRKMLRNFDNSYYDYSPYTELSKKSFNKLLAYRNF